MDGQESTEGRPDAKQEPARQPIDTFSYPDDLADVVYL